MVENTPLSESLDVIRTTDGKRDRNKTRASGMWGCSDLSCRQNIQGNLTDENLTATEQSCVLVADGAHVRVHSSGALLRVKKNSIDTLDLFAFGVVDSYQYGLGVINPPLPQAPKQIAGGHAGAHQKQFGSRVYR